MEQLKLTQEWDKVFPKSEMVGHSKATFHNRYGITLAAGLHLLGALHLGQLGIALRPGNGQWHQFAGQHLGIGHGKQRGAEGHLLAQHAPDRPRPTGGERVRHGADRAGPRGE